MSTPTSSIKAPTRVHATKASDTKPLNIEKKSCFSCSFVTLSGSKTTATKLGGLHSILLRTQKMSNNKKQPRRRRGSNNGDSSRESTNTTKAEPTTRARKRSCSKKDDDVKISSPVVQQPATIEPIPSSTSHIEPEKPSYFGLAEGEFIHAFSSVIQEISHQGDNVPADVQFKTQFHTSQPPNISLSKYLERVIKFTFCSAECYILSLVYMDRLVQSNPHFVISSLSIHRLLITSIMVAAKFFDDKYFSNEYYAKVGGMKKEELNKLEIEFLYLINFSLHFQPPEFEQYKEEFIVQPALQRREALKSDFESQHREKSCDLHSELHHPITHLMVNSVLVVSSTR